MSRSCFFFRVLQSSLFQIFCAGDLCQVSFSHLHGQFQCLHSEQTHQSHCMLVVILCHLVINLFIFHCKNVRASARMPCRDINRDRCSTYAAEDLRSPAENAVFCWMKADKSLRGLWENVYVWEFWDVHLLMTEFDCPEVTFCCWEDVKIQLLAN